VCFMWKSFVGGVRVWGVREVVEVEGVVVGGDGEGESEGVWDGEVEEDVDGGVGEGSSADDGSRDIDAGGSKSVVHSAVSSSSAGMCLFGGVAIFGVRGCVSSSLGDLGLRGELESCSATAEGLLDRSACVRFSISVQL
jgi:hypothetical protein